MDLFDRLEQRLWCGLRRRGHLFRMSGRDRAHSTRSRTDFPWKAATLRAKDYEWLAVPTGRILGGQVEFEFERRWELVCE